MPEENSNFYGHTLNVTGFLGGITFAAMILLMQSKNDITIPNWLIMPAWIPGGYLDLLIAGTAGISVVFVVAAIGMTRMASSELESNESYQDFIARLATSGFFGLMVLLPLLVLPFLPIGAIAVAIVEAITLSYYFHYLLDAARKK